MVEKGFGDLLHAAIAASLKDRDSLILALRYGLSGSKALTLTELSTQFGLSRQGVSAIILGAHRRITSRALKQLEIGLTDEPCARLATYLRNLIRFECDNKGQRLAALLLTDFKDVYPNVELIYFLASLVYPSRQSAKDDVDYALGVISERYWTRMQESRASHKFAKILSYTVWPMIAKKLTSEDIEKVKQSSKEPVTANRSTYYSAKMGRPVRCRSKLEFSVYQLLDRADEVLEYYEHSIEVPYQVAGQRITYYPDLFILLRDRRGIILEIAPRFRMLLWRNLLGFERIQDFCLRAGFGFTVTDGHRCLEQVRSYWVKQGYADEVMRYLREKGDLDWNAYKEIRDRHRANINDFSGLVVQNRLEFQLGPFKLGLPNRPVD